MSGLSRRELLRRGVAGGAFAGVALVFLGGDAAALQAGGQSPPANGSSGAAARTTSTSAGTSGPWKGHYPGYHSILGSARRAADRI